MLKILLSPAKSISKSPVSFGTPSTPIFEKQAGRLVSLLKQLSPQNIEKLMSVSPALAELNWSRYQEWTPLSDNSAPIQPAIAFTGEVYKGLDAVTFDEGQWNNAQQSIRILSGLYGILKPLDGIHAYRLEMGTKLQVDSAAKDLYSFWKESLTSAFQSELSSDDIVVNLASQEYSKALNFSDLKNKIVTPLFKDEKNGKLKTIMMYAKKARGSMARHIVREGIENIEGLKISEIDGYVYSEPLSTEKELVFTR